MRRELRMALAAGPLTGVVGLILFTLVHAIMVMPTAGPLFFGLPVVLIAGLVAGVAWDGYRRASPRAAGWHMGLVFAIAVGAIGVIEVAMPYVGSEPMEDPIRPMLGLGIPVALGVAGAVVFARNAQALIASGVLAALLGFAFMATTFGNDLRGWLGLFFLTIVANVLLAGVILERIHAWLLRRGSAGDATVHVKEEGVVG